MDPNSGIIKIDNTRDAIESFLESIDTKLCKEMSIVHASIETVTNPQTPKKHTQEKSAPDFDVSATLTSDRETTGPATSLIAGDWVLLDASNALPVEKNAAKATSATHTQETDFKEDDGWVVVGKDDQQNVTARFKQTLCATKPQEKTHAENVTSQPNNHKPKTPG